jgi:hypothetical protein
VQPHTTTCKLPSGIVAWFKAEDNAEDAVGNNHGTAVATTYGPGKVGRAFQFDGEGYVRVPDAPSLNSPAITVEAWVKGTTAQGVYRYLVAKGVHAEKSSSALTAAKTVVRWLRWAAVLGFVYSAWGGLFYDVVLRNMFLFSSFLFVAAGAKIAPRNRLTTAIVLAAALVLVSFRGHVLSNPPPGVTYDQLIIAVLVGNYRHFTLETLGAVLGVVFIFWLEKAKGSVASVPPAPAPR